MLKTHKKNLGIAVGILLLGQLLFFALSPRFLEVSYVNRIYATTAVKHRSEDLHKLNEAAHYFGQTMIGWLKFPHFMEQLRARVNLPEGAAISAHIQERQNIIFELVSPEPIELSALEGVKDFIQTKIDAYNAASTTEFLFSNVDYEQLRIQKTYAFGALLTLVASVLVILALWFLRHELKN